MTNLVSVMAQLCELAITIKVPFRPTHCIMFDCSIRVHDLKTVIVHSQQLRVWAMPDSPLVNKYHIR